MPSPVQVESWRTAYHGLLSERVLAMLSVLDREQNWSNILVDPPPRTAIVLAISNAVVVGFVAVGPDQDTTARSPAGQLYAICVRSDQRGRGIGTHLQHAALDRLRTLGITHAVLWVLEGNERAIRFIVATAGWPMVRGGLARDPKISIFLSRVCAVHCPRCDLARTVSSAG